MRRLVSVSIILFFLRCYLPGQENTGWFTDREVEKNVWLIDDTRAANIYLVIGKDSALLIDTGMGSADLAGHVRKLTDKPLIVVNTHGHPDHTGANYQFPEVYIHREDMASAASFNTPEMRQASAQRMLQGKVPEVTEVYKDTPINTMMIPVMDGYVFNLGDRKLVVMETPGHTAGEICLLDITNRLLFTGDNNNILVWLFLPNCKPLSSYLNTLENQVKRLSEFDTVLPGHGMPMPSDFIKDQVECVKRILDGSLERKPYKSFAGDAMMATWGRASVAFNPANL